MEHVPQIPHWPDRMERRGLMDALDRAHAIVWFDPSGQVVDGNENALGLFGLSLDGFLAQDHFSLCRESRVESIAARREWGRIVAGEQVHTERNFYRSDGQRIWSSAVYAAIKREDGTTRRVIAIIIDLTRLAWNPRMLERII